MTVPIGSDRVVEYCQWPDPSTVEPRTTKSPVTVAPPPPPLTRADVPLSDVHVPVTVGEETVPIRVEMANAKPENVPPAFTVARVPLADRVDRRFAVGPRIVAEPLTDPA